MWTVASGLGRERSLPPNIMWLAFVLAPLNMTYVILDCNQLRKQLRMETNGAITLPRRFVS